MFDERTKPTKPGGGAWGIPNPNNTITRHDAPLELVRVMVTVWHAFHAGHALCDV
jgi:hypothetical protein